MVCLNPLATERQKIWARPRLQACAAHAAAFPSSLQVLKIMAVTELETADRPGMVTRLGHVVLYGLALVLVLLAPILGMLVAAVAAWHAVLAQSIVLLPLGLFLVLVILSVYQRHGRSDLTVLSLMLAATASWFLLDSQARIEMLKWGGALVLPVELLVGALAVMVLLLVLLFVSRFSAQRKRRLAAARKTVDSRQIQNKAHIGAESG
jgi:cbb3-type cytochrome oxidase subunit 3